MTTTKPKPKRRRTYEETLAFVVQGQHKLAMGFARAAAEIGQSDPAAAASLRENALHLLMGVEEMLDQAAIDRVA
jgi:hypothetical protein